MTDSRVTQLPVLGVYEADADARVTQVVSQAMYGIGSDARVTQNVVMAIYELPSPGRVTQLVKLALYSGDPCVSQRAQCWKITRLDGTVFSYTAHDEPITYRGTTYIPCDSLRASATSGGITSGSESGDIELTGLIADDGITEEDIANGLFDGASVEVYLVPWSPNDTRIARRISKGIVARFEHSPTKYTATVQTPGIKLTQSPLLTAYTPACRWDLGSPQCGVNLDSTYIETGSVTGVFARNAVNATTFRSFEDSSRTEANDYFTFGTLTWTSGANNGISAEVKSFEYDVFELWDILPNEIEVGDTYEIVPGCAKNTTDCSTKFSNLINFGGFPNIPGRDSIYETPDAK
jgi:uncharacterized phage protein (TIGR02218 family)